MTAQALLQQQLAGYHDILEHTIADCQQETLDKNLPNATITSVGSVYAHVVFSEDEILHGMLQASRPSIGLTTGPAAPGSSRPALPTSRRSGPAR